MAIASWAKNYVGLPFVERGRSREGCDCWGLIRLVFLEQFSIELPDYLEFYESTLDGDAIDAALRRESARSNDWTKIRMCDLEAGDVLLARAQGKLWHTAVYVGGDLMLHVERGKDAVIESICSRGWEHRIQGAWRHNARLAAV